ncbi:MAG: shikimate kinase [Promethearchaeota archaeon]
MNSHKTNVSLVGFMGTGKTTLGAMVAERLGKLFVETDEIITRAAGKSIPSIFAEDGETRFRELEIQACKEAAGMRDAVVSCGGGVVLNFINLMYLRETSVVVCLDASPEVIYERIMAEGKEKRPLLAKPNPMAEIKRILDFRAPLYERASEFHVDTDSLSPAEVVGKIIKIYDDNK